MVITRSRMGSTLGPACLGRSCGYSHRPLQDGQRPRPSASGMVMWIWSLPAPGRAAPSAQRVWDGHVDMVINRFSAGQCPRPSASGTVMWIQSSPAPGWAVPSAQCWAPPEEPVNCQEDRRQQAGLRVLSFRPVLCRADWFPSRTAHPGPAAPGESPHPAGIQTPERDVDKCLGKA